MTTEVTPIQQRSSAVPDARIALTSISKSYGPVVALKDVTVEVHPGEVHALLGENGAGKSTLMGVASGVTAPDHGTVTIDGELVADATPASMRQHGLAIVHQHPALLPDLTVLENLRMSAPEDAPSSRSEQTAYFRAALDRVGLSHDLNERIEDLDISDRQLLELAKALLLKPRILILDEPTATLGSDRVDVLFAEMRALAAEGTAVVYITHRLSEVRETADRVTVLRDGRFVGCAEVATTTDDEILSMIVGRRLDNIFPDKTTAEESSPVVLELEHLHGPGFSDVSFTIGRGEIVGLAGVVGNGQSQVLQAIAGLTHSSGAVRLAGDEVARDDAQAAQRAGIAVVPADRHRDGLFLSMSVRENASASSLGSYASGGVVSKQREAQAVDRMRTSLNIKTSTTEALVSSLSGGNQQKVVIARTLMTEPSLLLAEEPTQGVDMGARTEIYAILRQLVDDGTALLVVSTDGFELAGLCDRVLVMSHGVVTTELVGDDVTEDRITQAILGAEVVTDDGAREEDTPAEVSKTNRIVSGTRRLLRTDYGPSGVLVLLIVLLGAYTFARNPLVLTSFNISSVLTLTAALGFIALGQLLVILTGGIDLSVGALAGFLVVVASFFIVDGASVGRMVLGLALMILASLVVGALHGGLIRRAGFTAVVATIVTSIAIQGLSLVLRPEQGGYINAGVTEFLNRSLGPIPIVFVAVVVVTVLLERGLRRGLWGVNLRAAGSHEESAHRLGVPVDRAIILAYVGCSALTTLGAILLMAQIGVGDASQGVTYTLASITAVVLGGASLFGGRGSFVGALLGALLIQQALNATVFLNLDQKWQYLFQGVLILAAAVVYSQANRRRSVE